MPLSADQLIEMAGAAGPKGTQLNFVIDADPPRPVTASFGRQQLLLHPQTGAVIPDAASGVRDFLRTVENWHRWLGGDANGTGASLIDVANLLFLFVIPSGIYLWLPAVWKWAVVRHLVLFRASYLNSKVRDFGWHHVFSFWMFIPLFVIALSGVVMSFPWANNLVYAAYGEQAPRRQGPPGGQGPAMNAPTRSDSAAAVAENPPQRASAQQLLDVARSRFVNWQRITIPASGRGQNTDLTAELNADLGRPPRQTLTLSTRDASVIRLTAPAAADFSQSPGQRARGWLRFAHTGEQYGVIGQTIAGLASLAACFLVYSGLALAWRRLIRPLYRRDE